MSRDFNYPSAGPQVDDGFTRDVDVPQTSTRDASHVRAHLRTPARGPLAPRQLAAVQSAPDMAADVKAFRVKFGVSYGGLPRALPDDGSRVDGHLLEEVEEFRVNHVALQLARQAGRPDDVAAHLEECLDALVDLVYVALGRAELMGFLTPRGVSAPSLFEQAWTRVHSANMLKVRVTSAEQSRRGDSNDVVKPPGWVAPRHADLVVPNAYTAEG